MSEQNPSNGTEQGRGQLAQKHEEGSEHCPEQRKGGSAGYRNQVGHTRMVGEDPLVRRAVINPSRIQRKAEKPTSKVTPARTGRQHP